MKDAYPYWEDPYKFVFDAKIVSSSKQKDGFLIGLSEDVVRPEGGGQAGDRGVIKLATQEVPFSNTISSDDGATLVTSMTIEEQECEIHIDKEWRLAMMRNHTGEHLFMSAMKKIDSNIELGYIWIDGMKGTVEVEGLLNESDIFTAEELVQRWIMSEIPVNTRYVASTELDESVRARESVTEKHDQVRILQIEGVDKSACSGTHVSNTGEIHAFKILDYSTVESGLRVEFGTAEHALNVLSKIYNQVLPRKKSYPFEMHQIGPVLDKAKRTADEMEEMTEKVAQLLAEGPHIEELDAIEFRNEFLPGFEIKQMREILMSMSFDRPTAILYFAPGTKSNLIFWTHSLEKEASEYIGDIVASLGGRGGGSRDAYNGGFTDVEDPRKLYDELVTRLRTALS
jgi:alanyl-tRNA synthetase